MGLSPPHLPPRPPPKGEFIGYKSITKLAHRWFILDQKEPLLRDIYQLPSLNTRNILTLNLQSTDPNFLKKTFLLREKFLFTFLKIAYNFKRLKKIEEAKPTLFT